MGRTWFPFSVSESLGSKISGGIVGGSRRPLVALEAPGAEADCNTSGTRSRSSSCSCSKLLSHSLSARSSPRLAELPLRRLEPCLRTSGAHASYYTHEMPHKGEPARPSFRRLQPPGGKPPASRPRQDPAAPARCPNISKGRAGLGTWKKKHGLGGCSDLATGLSIVSGI